MPITLVTGLPRAGKTLWTICHVKERAEREGRKVYTCNIPGVSIPGWETFDHPDKWEELPDGAILVIDEVQDFWPKQSGSGAPPKPILNLSKHGKRGFDIYFITQEPNLIHSTPRDLCAEHYYVVRAWGSHNALVHKFTRYELHPDKRRKQAEKTPFRYPKEAFGWYKSADVHNIKRKIPMRLLALPVGALVIVVGGWFGFQTFLATVSGKATSDNPIAQLLGAKPKPSGASAPPSSQAQTSGARPPQSEAAPSKVSMSAEDWLASRKARIPDFPHTAPAYDEVTRPAVAPYPAACVHMGNKCKCYTQQGTVMATSADVCLQIVAHGFFVDWNQAPSSMGSRDAMPVEPRSREGQVVAVPVAMLQPPSMPAAPASVPQKQPGHEWSQGLARRNAEVRSSVERERGG